MKEEVDDLNCGRENDLIAFLYGELNDGESQSFQRHMRDCPACSAELATFRIIRESVVAWRNDSLGGAVSPGAMTDSRVTRADGKKPSALAALREFFNLSPLWMKGAVAFASVLFCLFAGLAVARWRDTRPAPIATNSNSQANSEQQLNALVEQRVQDELRRINGRRQQAPTPPMVVDNTSQPNHVRRVKHGAELANNVTEQKARRPLSRVEREQLAADLRLISAKNEGELDLLDDRINQ